MSTGFFPVKLLLVPNNCFPPSTTEDTGHTDACLIGMSLGNVPQKQNYGSRNTKLDKFYVNIAVMVTKI
jgi:hypothetical protein